MAQQQQKQHNQQFFTSNSMPVKTATAAPKATAKTVSVPVAKAGPMPKASATTMKSTTNANDASINTTTIPNSNTTTRTVIQQPHSRGINAVEKQYPNGRDSDMLSGVNGGEWKTPTQNKPHTAAVQQQNKDETLGPVSPTEASVAPIYYNSSQETNAGE